MDPARLHPRLAADCHILGALPSALLLLHRDARLPWCILVPDSEETDLLRLDAELRGSLLADAARIGAVLRREGGCSHINTAAIGNLVPQLHLHVVGRRDGDACWPLPVWGHLDGTPGAYTAADIEHWRALLLGEGDEERRRRE